MGVMMRGHAVHNRLIAQIKKCLFPLAHNLRIEKEGIGLIKVFSEYSADLARGVHEIAHADMVLLDENKEPILIIEPETSSSPKTFGRSIPVYSMAGEIRFSSRKYPIRQPLLLMIVIPDYKHDVQEKRSQLEDMQNKAKRLIATRGSKLKDVYICQISDFEIKIKELLENNGYSSIARRLK
jgi:hypothetical protein